MPRILPTSVIVAAVAATALLPATALADRVQHSQHIDLNPVADAPLDRGFIENIHANGPKIYAHEIYKVNGAVTSAELDVTIFAHPFDPVCDGDPAVELPAATFTTNHVGNGQGRATITTEDVAGFPRGTHGVIWEITDGTHTYVTDCTAVTLD